MAEYKSCDPCCNRLDDWCNSAAAACLLAAAPNTTAVAQRIIPSRLVALESTVHGKVKWRCHHPASLLTNTTASTIARSLKYVSGASFCTRDAELTGLLSGCRRKRACTGHMHNLPLASSKAGNQPMRHASCAVVSNSGIHLQHEYGWRIDGHEAVFRFNDGPTDGYEVHVGERTTYRVLNGACTKVLNGLSNPTRAALARLANVRCHRILGMAHRELLNRTMFAGIYPPMAGACKVPFWLTSNASRGCKVCQKVRGWLQSEKGNGSAPSEVQHACSRTGKPGEGLNVLTGTAHVLTALTMCANVSLFGFTFGFSSAAASPPKQTRAASGLLEETNARQSDRDAARPVASAIAAGTTPAPPRYHYYGDDSEDKQPASSHKLSCDGALLTALVKRADHRVVAVP